MTDRYIDCSRCLSLRDQNEWELALQCRSCDGKGKVRNPASYHCNNCGESLCSKEEGSWPSGLIEATVSGGYSSFHLFDCTSYTFSLCEKCLRGLFTSFKVPPEVKDRLGGGPEFETYTSDLELYQHRLWEEADLHIQRLLEGGCNWREHCHNRAIYRVLSYGGNLRDQARCEEHKWYSNGFDDRLAPFEQLPFLKAQTPEELEAVSQGWSAGVKLPDESRAAG